MGSLEDTDAASAAVQKTPHRISLQSIKDKIAAEYSFTLDEAVGNSPLMPGMECMSICVLVMENGFIVIGKATPADPNNFNAELGKKFAYEDAVRQMWPLEAYLLKERMAIIDGKVDNG